MCWYYFINVKCLIIFWFKQIKKIKRKQLVLIFDEEDDDDEEYDEEEDDDDDDLMEDDLDDNDDEMDWEFEIQDGNFIIVDEIFKKSIKKILLSKKKGKKGCLFYLLKFIDVFVFEQRC